MLKALDLARAIADGSETAGSVLARCAAAIDVQEKEIAAFVHLDLAGAEKAAADPALKNLPLRGLPVAVKDIIDVAGLPTAMGTPVWADYVPRADAAVVSMLRRAGGIVLGKTATSPLAYLDPAATQNPRRHSHTPGGSSAGSAAAVAAGMAPLALGTQTGGSVLRPASFCGIAGIKPSFGLLPTIGCKCVSWTLDTLGLMGARVADIAFGLSALTGRALEPQANLSPPRIALLSSPPWAEASPDAQEALLRAADAATRAGAEVRELKLPDALGPLAFAACQTIYAFEGAQALAWEWDFHRDALTPAVRELIAEGLKTPPAAYDEARSIAKAARDALPAIWADTDAILTLSAPGEAPAGHGSTGSSMFNRLWTLMGTPCISVPGLTGASDLPIGMQIVARFGRDAAALAAAQFLEQAIATEINS